MPTLSWRADGIPVSERFDDPYFSLDDGLGETEHVFLSGNDLPARFAPGFHISELGFGTGLNALATWRSWEQSGQTTPLRFTSFEAYPLAAEDMERALSHWPELRHYTKALLAAWAKGEQRFTTETLDLKVIVGDATQTVPAWDDKADAWFLDGFSPAKNPELWSETLMAQVAAHTKPGGTFATYTAAGPVRRALQNAGFTVTRAHGFGRKRHMSHGVL